MHHPSIGMASKGTIPFGQPQIAGSSGNAIASGNYDPYALHTGWVRGNVLNRDHLVHHGYPNQLYDPYYLDYNQSLRMDQMGAMNMSRAEKMVNLAALNARQTSN